MEARVGGPGYGSVESSLCWWIAAFQSKMAVGFIVRG